jgi:ABC-type Fe3+ transport system permease subunit
LFFLASVSIPLILAGGQYTSLESAIYQKIVMAHDWPLALNLFIVQTIFIGALVFSLGQMPTTPTENSGDLNSDYLGLPTGLACVVFPVAVIVLSLLIKIPMGLVGLSQQTDVLAGWQKYLMGSVLVGFVSGGVGFVGLSFITYFYLEGRLRRWLALVIVPSSVVLAFAFFLMPGTSPSILYYKVAVALGLSFLPALKRFGMIQKLETLAEQAEVAEFLGASRGKVFWRGVWPQALPQISLLSGLGAIWAMGDFAMSRVITGRDMTLAMWTQSLVDQYRWDIALVLSWLVLGTSFLVFGFFWSLSYVSNKALSENL